MGPIPKATLRLGVLLTASTPIAWAKAWRSCFTPGRGYLGSTVDEIAAVLWRRNAGASGAVPLGRKRISSKALAASVAKRILRGLE